MPLVSRTTKKSLGLLAFAIGCAVLNLPSFAIAADMYDPYGRQGRYGPPPGYYEAPVDAPYGPPVARRGIEVDEEGCRVFLRRGVDPYGREIVRRVRVCEEDVAGHAPYPAAPQPRYGYGPRVYDVPRRYP
jgi:hypothetical protein